MAKADERVEVATKDVEEVLKDLQDALAKCSGGKWDKNRIEKIISKVSAMLPN
jgi:hypothetical protein